jgi:hypothetical protein
MEFLLEYEDGGIGWKSWDKDLFDSLPYEEYCRSIPQLYSMIFTVKVAAAQMSTINRQAIDGVRPGLIGYMDLRWYTFDWYAQLGLPNEGTTIYVLQFRYGDWVHDDHRKIRVIFTITGDQHIFNHFTVLTWGSYLELVPTMDLCDREFITKHPQIMGNQQESQDG